MFKKVTKYAAMALVAIAAISCAKSPGQLLAGAWEGATADSGDRDVLSFTFSEPDSVVEIHIDYYSGGKKSGDLTARGRWSVMGDSLRISLDTANTQFNLAPEVEALYTGDSVYLLQAHKKLFVNDLCAAPQVSPLTDLSDSAFTFSYDEHKVVMRRK